MSSLLKEIVGQLYVGCFEPTRADAEPAHNNRVLKARCVTFVLIFTVAAVVFAGGVVAMRIHDVSFVDELVPQVHPLVHQGEGGNGYEGVKGWGYPLAPSPRKCGTDCPHCQPGGTTDAAPIAFPLDLNGRPLVGTYVRNWPFVSGSIYSLEVTTDGRVAIDGVTYLIGKADSATHQSFKLIHSAGDTSKSGTLSFRDEIVEVKMSYAKSADLFYPMSRLVPRQP